MINPFVLAFFLEQALGGVVTVHRTSTLAPVTLTRTIEPSAEIISATTTTEVTLFQAVTTPLTIASGTFYTTIGTTKPPPVTQQSSYSHVDFTDTVNPSQYTNPLTLTRGTSTSPASSSSSSASVTTSSEPSASSSEATSSNGKTTSPQGPVSSSSSVAQASSASSSASATAAASSAAPPSGENYYSDQKEIFVPVDTADPLDMFPRRGNGLDVPQNIKIDGPIQTNKFYANLFLGGQNQTVFAQPYELFQSTDKDYFGLGVGFVDAEQRVFGEGSPAKFYTNPLMLKSFVFSAKEFNAGNMDFSVTESGPFSVTAHLGANGGQIDFPVSIGMGLVTGVYNKLTPRLFSQLGVNTLKKETGPKSGIQKYQATLFNGKVWNIYANTDDNDFSFSVTNNFEIVGSKAIDGLVLQLAVLPDNKTDDSPIDSAAGAYPVGASISASVTNDAATYSINYDVKGDSKSGSTLLYALPHHVQAFTDNSKKAAVDLTAYSPTKGPLAGVLANKLEMAEPLYTDLQWLPYQVDNQNYGTFSSDSLQLLAKVLNDEISEDMHGQTNSASTYTAGKSFDKFAYIVLVASEILNDTATTKQGLERLKTALDPWLSNKQLTPFIYDTNWKGVTSSAGEKDDFGAPWYNDHHFHYGYYVHTAAVIGMVDKKLGGTWAKDNKDWVNSLIRDVANPSKDDSHFPISRMFDFYHGHSWAAGLWESGDGKNEESTSEDINFSYGMKLWGQVIGDAAMEARGDLMLSIQKRSMDNYFYYKDDNKVEPSQYIGNRVPGISYENKLDYTTFFGTNAEYIHGIQMIPITGASGLVRSKDFAKQEWDSKLATLAPGLKDGWAGILRSNQVLFDPSEAYKWFSQDGFKSEWLDGGASRTWYLALAASLNN